MARILFVLVLLPTFLFAQHRQPPHSSTIKLRMKKLNFLGSVLYLAAHPDDENTRIITAMANDRLAATAYLSMTRGDGGQNLIGPEMRDLLGLIRTQELLAARRIDGGQQFFTRAIDFGYSKSAEETFTIWGKDSVLHDVVKVFRQFQPDVIITRFPPDERAGHGHHTASAMLAIEAFDKAARTDVFPGQLRELAPWQSKRLYTNTGRWWNNTINENTPGIISIDVGAYNPLLGESYSEIAAISRSQHKSQGFGSRGTRGRQLEFLEYQKGERAEKDVFEGINTTWSRIKGGAGIQPLVDVLIKNFDEEKPARSIPALLTLRKKILQLDNSVWRERKLAEVEELIIDCAGLFIEVTSDAYWVAPGEAVRLNFEIVNRAGDGLAVERIRVPKARYDTTAVMTLKPEVPLLFHSTQVLSPSAGYSDPYWLRHPHGIGLFTVPERAMIGKPENDATVSAIFTVRVGDETLELQRPLIYKWTDPVNGESSRPFEIVPPLFLNLSEEVIIFRNQEPRSLRVLAKSSSRNPVTGKLKLEVPAGWKSEPAEASLNLSKTGEEQWYSFTVFPSANEMTGSIRAVADIEGSTHDKAIRVINYDHIPVQTLLPEASAKVVRVDLRNEPGMVAYLKGAGDDIPAALRNMGYEVWEMKNEDVTPANLSKADAVVMGVRTLNTNERIRYLMPPLLEYVRNGGTLVLQYNTNFDLETDVFSPYMLKISRDRVSQEDSDVRILKPDHKVITFPNKITAADFEGWVQERGLYFPNQWDPAFEAILSMNDGGETPKDGGLLIAPYGKGYYVYTGISFFRELPEGVAGAYKLFSNILSLGKNPSESPAQQAGDKNTKTKRKKSNGQNGKSNG
jgi:LmbE family N-acetylglucosaminyl deacetylase